MGPRGSRGSLAPLGQGGQTVLPALRAALDPRVSAVLLGQTVRPARSVPLGQRAIPAWLAPQALRVSGA